MSSGSEGNEELRSIRVRPRIRHREQATLSVGQEIRLVSEFLTVDTLATCSVLVGDIAALHHESWDNAMEDVLLVEQSFALLTCTQHSEILNSLGHELFE